MPLVLELKTQLRTSHLYFLSCYRPEGWWLFLTLRPRIRFAFMFVEARGQGAGSFSACGEAPVHLASVSPPLDSCAPSPNARLYFRACFWATRSARGSVFPIIPHRPDYWGSTLNTGSCQSSDFVLLLRYSTPYVVSLDCLCALRIVSECLQSTCRGSDNGRS